MALAPFQENRPSLEAFLRAAARRLTASSTPHLDARILAGEVLGLDDAGLIAQGRRRLSADEKARIEALLLRRIGGEPVSQIVGRKEFYGLLFAVAPGVLTPRPDSESLIEAARQRIKKDAALRILDLGVGSGALLGALLSVFPNARGLGVDINPKAADIAWRNLQGLGLGRRAAIIAADWAEPLTGEFDLIVSNPPYIPLGERRRLPVAVRDFEDERALFGGNDGLSAYRAILAPALERLSPGGLIILELGQGQNEAVAALVRQAAPGARIETAADLCGRPRAMAVWPPLEKSI
jgi:release factor glutamine methyltransferase